MLEEQVVTFWVDEEEYAVPKAHIKEITCCQAAARLSGFSDYMEGVLNSDGHLIPVVNLSTILGLPNKRVSNRQVLIMEMNSQEVGVIVDKVTEMTHLNFAAIAPTPGVYNERGSCLRGIGKTGNRLVVLLDMGVYLDELSSLKATTPLLRGPKFGSKETNPMLRQFLAQPTLQIPNDTVPTTKDCHHSNN